MANTHMAVIHHLDGRLTHVANGNEPFVREHLGRWLNTHAASAFDTPMILQIIDTEPEG